ncbi:hypothetical protein BHE74_00033313 [Ensete ventricosum]|nr:hypothetical protein BHE74_00033313 [Ensete ventricosum]
MATHYVHLFASVLVGAPDVTGCSPACCFFESANCLLISTTRHWSDICNLLIVVYVSSGLLVHSVRHGASCSAPYRMLSFHGFPSGRCSAMSPRAILGDLHDAASSYVISSGSYGTALPRIVLGITLLQCMSLMDHRWGRHDLLTVVS